MTLTLIIFDVFNYTDTILVLYVNISCDVHLSLF